MGYAPVETMLAGFLLDRIILVSANPKIELGSKCEVHAPTPGRHRVNVAGIVEVPGTWLGASCGANKYAGDRRRPEVERWAHAACDNVDAILEETLLPIELRQANGLGRTPVTGQRNRCSGDALDARPDAIVERSVQRGFWKTEYSLKVKHRT